VSDQVKKQGDPWVRFEVNEGSVCRSEVNEEVVCRLEETKRSCVDRCVSPSLNQ